MKIYQFIVIKKRLLLVRRSNLNIAINWFDAMVYCKIIELIHFALE